MKMCILMILLFSSTSVVVATSCCIPDPQDAASLLEFKASLYADPQGFLSTWGVVSSSCYTNSSNSTRPAPGAAPPWPGVQCNQQGRVVALQLPALSLQGSIPPSLGHLSFLHTLNLSTNNFFGSIPPWLFANCTSLQFLDLDRNNLSGRIPLEVGMLQHVIVLHLTHNNLVGGVPHTLGNCSAVEDLQISFNQLSGGIPRELGMLQRVRVLYLGGNGLTGGVPTTLANCSALESLVLAINQLSGGIPPELALLQRLQILFLWKNVFTGGVQTTLANCSALQFLDLSENPLGGRIPQELGMLQHLGQLYLHDTNLSGEIPTSLMNCSRLLIVWLHHNQLSGGIPVQIGKLQSLEQLYLWGNGLAGSLPVTLLNCTALQILHISANQLTGPQAFLHDLLQTLTHLQILNLSINRFQSNLPDAFNRCTNLTYLDLSHNSFTGTLPHSVAGLTRLIRIRFEQNHFQGTIPSMFSTSLHLLALDLSFNNLSGGIPDTLGNLPSLLALDLSHNYLVGQVPPQLGQLTLLLSLNLSRNGLSGEIPAALSGCVEMASLNLSYNKLSGDVPVNLAKLQSLQSLDLSYNQLTGSLPQIPLFQNASISNFSGNPGLCGPTLDRACNSSTSPARFHFRVKLAVGIIVPALVVLAAIFTILVTWCQKWRSCRSVNDPTTHDLLLISEKFLKVTAQELQQATHNFGEENIIGSGSVSVVYRAMLPRMNVAVAVKVLRNELALSAEAEARFRREVQLLAKVRHRNIVRICGCCINLEIKALILELVPNGNLADHCYGSDQMQGTPLSMEEKLRVLRGVAHGLHYLHDLHPEGPIVHCDMKPENILLDADLEPHISDFGIAKLLHGDSYEASASLLLRGSIGYIPPEYGYNCQVSAKGDVYSFGVIMLELLTGKRPTMCIDDPHSLVSWARSAYLHDEVISTNFNKLIEQAAADKRAIQVALMCTNDWPSNRPSMHQVVQFLTSLS